jgi:hypothetical protein
MTLNHWNRADFRSSHIKVTAKIPRCKSGAATQFINVTLPARSTKEKPGLSPEQLETAEKAQREARRHLGNFHTFIFGAELEQVEGLIQELREQIDEIWTSARH